MNPYSCEMRSLGTLFIGHMPSSARAAVANKAEHNVRASVACELCMPPVYNKRARLARLLHILITQPPMPSDMKPVLHGQAWLPSVFMHVLLAGQPPLLDAHSSMSTQLPALSM